MVAPAGTHRVKLTGAINEVLSLRFAVRPGGTRVETPEFRVAPLTSIRSRIDSNVIELFRIHRVPVGRFPGWHVRSIPPSRRESAPLDVLVPIRAPLGGMPAVLQPGETYHFWVDVAIPKGTLDGIYTTEIELVSGRTRVGAVNLRIDVCPIVLPNAAGPLLIAEVDHRSLFRHHVNPEYGLTRSGDDWRGSPTASEQDVLLRSTLQTLQQHGLTPVLPDLTPVAKVGARGDVKIDWGQYDAVVEPCLDGRGYFNREASPVWPIPYHGIGSHAPGGAAGSSLGFTSVSCDYLAQCARHFDDNGWLDRSYILPLGKPTVNPESIHVTRQFTAAVRRADERLAVASRLWPQDITPYGWVDYPAADFSNTVDIWVPPAQFFDTTAMIAERASGRRTWLGIDRPPFSGSIAACAPETYVRVLTWQATALGAEAVYLGCVNDWPDSTVSSTPERCVLSNPNVLLYPGGPFGLNEPVPSVRLKHLRQSSQDAAYYRLLGKHGLGHIGKALVRSLSPRAGSDAYRTHFADGRPIGWVDDPEVFDLARAIMLSALDDEVGSRSETRSAAFARTAAWRRLMLTTRMLYIHVDGTRVRLRGARSAWRADVECSLTIVNRTRVPIAGTVRFGDHLPEGWTADTDGLSIPPIGPNSSRRVTLTALATNPPTGRSSFVSLPVEFVTDTGAVYRTDARVACAVAVPYEGPVRIDGDLADWPPGTGNVASGFRLAVHRPSRSSGQNLMRPHYSTTGFVMRDGENLYIAVNCECDAETAIRASRYNRVEYDDLIPVGDELIEVLIDPLNAGTRSPADLYRIVVKPSGAYLTETGIHADPPCGQRTPWAVDLDVATGSSSGRWTVELRVPLASFGGSTTQHTIWGFNIARFDAPRQEFASWSGAPGNVYDPLSLGNLFLP